MAHESFAEVQEWRIKEVYKSVHDDVAKSSSLILLDYKINVRVMYYRESNLHFQGKKGIKWHGSVVSTAEKRPNRQAMEGKKMYHNLRTYGIAQIVADDTIQDVGAVCDILKSVVMSIFPE